MNSPTVQKPKVLLVVGAGRSGTTLVSSMLGQLEGYFSAGELNYFWDAGLTKNQLCSCGEKLCECSVWSNILKRKFNTATPEDYAEFGRLSRSVIRRLNIPLLRYPALMPQNLKIKWDKCLKIYDDLYQSIADETGAAVIVDTSKDPSHALFLARSKKIELYILHVVRDARAVAYSRQRKKRQISKVGKEEYMPIQGYAKSSIKWLGINTICELTLKQLRYKKIKYESDVSDPEDLLREINNYLNFLTTHPTHERHHTKILHTALGNPGRFTFSRSEITTDTQWKIGMKFWSKLIVTAITWPLLLRYRYSLFDF